MAPLRFFASLPVLTATTTVCRDYGDLIPVVLVCNDETFAANTVATVVSAFAGWRGPFIGEFWSDADILSLNIDPALNTISPRALYVVLRPNLGLKTITTEYRKDVLPLFATEQGRDVVKIKKVPTIAQALVYIAAGGDLERLQGLGLDWAHGVKTSARIKDRAHTPSMNVTKPSLDATSISVASPSAGVTTAGRKVPCCRTCKKPMKGHSKELCRDVSVSSLDRAMEGMSVDAGDKGGSVDGRLKKASQAENAKFLIISLKDLASVDAATQAQGLKSRVIPVSLGQSDVVAYIYGTDHRSIQALVDDISKQKPLAGDKCWMKVSAAIAVGSITTWATLACL